MLPPFPEATKWQVFFQNPANWVQVIYDFFTFLSAVYSAVNLLIIVLIRRGQARFDRTNRNTQNFISLLDFMQTEHVYLARQYMYLNLNGKPLDQWTEVDNSRAGTVCSNYDVAGLFVHDKLIDKKLFLDFWGKPFKEACEILDRYMELRSYHWKHFYWLIEQAKNHSNPAL